MTVRLQPEREEALDRLVARGDYASTEEAVAAAVERLLVEQPPTQSEGRPSIEEVIEEIRSRYPADVFDGFPEDGAEQHGHYIYGLPKRTE